MQVLEDEQEWLIETLPREQFFQRLKRALAPYLAVHLLEARLVVFDTEQRKEIGDTLF